MDRIEAAAPITEVILLTAYGTFPDGVQAIKSGAFDYITKGDNNMPLVARAAEKAAMLHRLARLEKHLSEERSFERIVGEASSLRAAFDLARKVAATDAAVLLTGETGRARRSSCSPSCRRSCCA